VIADPDNTLGVCRIRDLTNGTDRTRTTAGAGRGRSAGTCDRRRTATGSTRIRKVA
jgi:hypothetical protein